MRAPSRWIVVPKVAPNGLAAATLLAFLATAGLFYVNIMAAIVDGLINGLGLSQVDAGRVGSVNIYGAAAGVLLSVYLIKRLHWRRLSTLCLALLIVLDLLSIPMRSYELLLLLRAAHGTVGGISVGVGLAIIARTASPDRSFGVLLFVQFGLGGLGVLTLPNLVPLFGTAPLFLALALFSTITLLMLPFLPDYPPAPVTGPRKASGRIDWFPYILAMLAVFLFQAANMALLAYILQLGLVFGLDRAYASGALGIATWVALIGPGLVVLLGLRHGRSRSLLLAMLLTLAGTAAFHFSDRPAVYLLANCATGITWGFVIPYLFGLASEFDEIGRTAAFAGVVSKLGLATGPLVASLLLAGGANFGDLINYAMIGLGASAVLMLAPAFVLDRRQSRPGREQLLVQ